MALKSTMGTEKNEGWFEGRIGRKSYTVNILGVVLLNIACVVIIEICLCKFKSRMGTVNGLGFLEFQGNKQNFRDIRNMIEFSVLRINIIQLSVVISKIFIFF